MLVDTVPFYILYVLKYLKENMPDILNDLYLDIPIDHDCADNYICEKEAFFFDIEADFSNVFETLCGVNFYDWKTENTLTSEKGVDTYLITHPIIKQVNAYYDYLQCTGDSCFYKFTALYRKAYNYLHVYLRKAIDDYFVCVDIKKHRKVTGVRIEIHSGFTTLGPFIFLYAVINFLLSLEKCIEYVSEEKGHVQLF